MEAQSDLETLKQWLSKQPHLPQNLDDRLLINFLYCCDFSLETTKSAMELFFVFRADCPEVFSDRDPLSPKIRAAFDIMDICALPQLTPEGYGCLVVRFAEPDSEKFNFYDIVKAFFMIGDMRARVETELVKGLVPIMDMTGWSLRHLAKAPILSLKKYIQYCQEAQPVKLQHIHIVNSTPLFERLFAVIRPFVKGEIIALIHTHSPGSDTLHKFVPKDILPKEYGGLAGTMSEIKVRCQRQIGEDREWFLSNEWMADESKRIGKRTVRPVMNGSFRSLSLD